jgi:hypothetical protein
MSNTIPLRKLSAALTEVAVLGARQHGLPVGGVTIHAFEPDVVHVLVDTAEEVDVWAEFLGSGVGIHHSSSGNVHYVTAGRHADLAFRVAAVVDPDESPAVDAATDPAEAVRT